MLDDGAGVRFKQAVIVPKLGIPELVIVLALVMVAAIAYQAYRLLITRD